MARSSPISFSCCTPSDLTTDDKIKDARCVGSKEDPITSGDVEVAQEAWAKGIVDIGKVYQDKGD